MAGGTPRQGAGETRGRMGRIQQLPAELRSYVDRRLREGAAQQAIIQETRDMLADLGEPPLSSSGLNRYASKAQRAGRRIREAREAAAAWSRGIGEESGGDVGAFTVEILRTLAWDLAQRAENALDDEDGEPPSVEMVRELALAVQRLERAGEAAAKREREMRREIAAAAEQEALKQGVGADTAAALRDALTRRPD